MGLERVMEIHEKLWEAMNRIVPKKRPQHKEQGPPLTSDPLLEIAKSFAEDEKKRTDQKKA